MMQRTKQAGDTIVEVLIAVVVLAAVLAGAYIAARNSSNTTVRNRERDQGVKLAQQQFEILRPALNSPDANLAAVSRTFCLYVDTADSNKIKSSQNSASTIASFSPGIIETEYDPALFCKMDAAGNKYSASSDGIPYYVAIEKNYTSTDLYKVSVRWDRSGGGEVQKTESLYRVYPE